ncbi:MAG: FKBP-type peptidyl-prolyl cis-trans isomerase [Bacteroidaceae bacterium]|nr:FKBP-type peptidyl-prolyl cis-trans isomerase [Bacteroidaceae bacterium]
MKKLTLMAFAAIAFVTVSCGQKAPKADLKTDADTLAYAFGYSQAEGMKQALMQQGVDTAYMDDFYKGLFEGASSGDDKKKAAYLIGVQFGQIISQRMVPGVSSDLYGNDSTKTISLSNLMAGLMSGVKRDTTIMNQMKAQETFTNLSAKIKAKQYEATIQAGKDFIAKYAQQSGVKQLGTTGIYYKVLTEGTGAKPETTSKVTVNYEGKTIEGKVFDSSYQRKEPAKMRADQVIKGWTEVLKNMPVGSKWECVIPQELAYGERQAGAEITPYSTLVFTIELISIDKDE